MPYKNKDDKKAYQKKYRKDHSEERKQYQKDHREEINAYYKKYHKDHREENLVYYKKNHKDHRDKEKAYKKKYYKVVTIIKQIKKRLKIGNVCECCGLKDIFNLTIDHIVSKEMKRKFKKYKNFDIEKPSNLQILCCACNASKNGHKKRCTLQHNNPKIKKMVTKARRRKSKK